MEGTASYIGDGTSSASYLHLVPPPDGGSPTLSSFSDATKSPPIKGSSFQIQQLALLSQQFLS